MPEDVQVDLVRSIPGLEKAEIVRPAYGVEYDHIDARELRGAFYVLRFASVSGFVSDRGLLKISSFVRRDWR